MTNLFSVVMLGNMKFGLGAGDNGNPALYLFNFPVYLYALCIVTGMCLAILIGGLYFKKRGYDPYDVTIYALAVIPIGVLGARAYVYIFPWQGRLSDWSTYFDFRSGGLGIYGGVIMGYLAAMVVAKIKKQDFRIITDSVLPGVLLAQSLGRWGNFFNQEAYGNLITNNYDALWHTTSGLFAKFNGYAVWIDGANGWYQATFFYESVCTFLGFLLCVLVLTRSKHYKLGWCTVFYGIYYGVARLIIEGMRTDSLFLWIGTRQTDIKISQLVSIFTIVLGIWTITKIYRRELHGLYKKSFKSEVEELSKSRWVLIALSVVLLGVGVTMFALGGESKFIIGFFCVVFAVYSALGVWSLWDRLQLYCNKCGEKTLPVERWQTPREKHFVEVICYGVVLGLLIGFGLFSLIKWGVYDGISNGIVLCVACVLTAVAIFIWKFLPAYKSLATAPSDEQKETMAFECSCGESHTVKLNKFLLFLFPPKVYIDYGVENLKPWVDPDKGKKKKTKNVA